MKRLFLVAALMACVLASCQKIEMGEHSVTTAYWQSALPDDMPVCMVSLPGAHDAATSSIKIPIVKGFAKTQVIPIDRQWQYGVRVFDLRPAVVDDDLLICHSTIKTKTSFADAIGSILDALQQNSSEFAVVVIRHEEEADGCSDKWAGMMADYINSLRFDKVVRDFSPDMTVGQIRGRILFLLREDIGNEWIGARLRGWTSSDEIERQKSATIGDGVLWVQDYYDPDGADDKMDAIKGLMSSFAANTVPDIWCINHASGYNSAIFGAPNYGSNAENVNKATAEYIRTLKGSVGFVLMDFAGAKHYKSFDVGGDELVRAVIEQNPLKTKVSFQEGVSYYED